MTTGATMIKASILAALNKQIQHEQSNAHAYDAMSLFFGRLGLHGFEAFMAQQAGEERAHARKFIRHVADRGGRVEPAAIAAPSADTETPLQAVNAVRDMERATTESIHRLFKMAREEAD